MNYFVLIVAIFGKGGINIIKICDINLDETESYACLKQEEKEGECLPSTGQFTLCYNTTLGMAFQIIGI